VKDEGKIAHLTALKGGKLKLFEAELLAPGSYDAAFKGVDAVIHVAAAVILQSKDPQKEVVDTTVLGTRNVLASASKANIKVLVLTSSVVALLQHPAKQNHVYTEADWSQATDVSTHAYEISKAREEQDFWAWAKEHPTVRSVAILPGLVAGAIRTAKHSTASSVSLVSAVLNGAFKDGAPRAMSFPPVSLRDIGELHIAAIERPEAKGRYVAATSNMLSFLDFARLLKPEFPSAPFPEKLLGDKSPTAYFNSERAEELLGRRLEAPELAIQELAQSFHQFGLFSSTRATAPHS